VKEEEEEEPKIPLQSTSEKRKNTKSKDDKSCVPCNQLTIESWNGRQGVHHHMFITIGIDTNETYRLDYKYPIFCKNLSSMLIVKNGTEMEENDIIKKKQLESIEVVSQY
jgi:hypothetical protein